MPPGAAKVQDHLLKVTSGTTAEPRVIRFSAAQLLADCDNICDTMGLGADDRNYGVISFAHSYGFSNLITPLLCRGIRLVAAGDAMPRASLIMACLPARRRYFRRFQLFSGPSESFGVWEALCACAFRRARRLPGTLRESSSMAGD